MENMDKGLAVPKRMLINRPKLSQMPQKLSAQAQKFGISREKKASLGIRSPCIKRQSKGGKTQERKRNI